MSSFIGGIISMAVGVVVLANVFLSVVHDTCTSGWPASEAAMWTMLGIAGIVGLVYGVLSVFGIV